MTTNHKLPDLFAVLNITQTLAQASNAFHASLLNLPFGSEPAAEIARIVQELIECGNTTGLEPLLDNATSLWAILDILTANGYNLTANTITVSLPHASNTALNDLATRLHGLKQLTHHAPTLPYIADPLAPNAWPAAPSTDGPSPGSIETC